MEPSDFPFWPDDSSYDPSPAAARLASALVDRLNAVLPHPFRVRSMRGGVALFEGTTLDGICDVAGVLDQDLEDDDELEAGALAAGAASVACNVLNSVQDAISEATTVPWPALPDGRMAEPRTRTDGTRVYLWYGPDEREDHAVLAFPPIVLADLRDSE